MQAITTIGLNIANALAGRGRHQNACTQPRASHKASKKLRASGVEPYAHNCDALRSNFVETFSRVTKWWRRSRQGESPDGSDRLHLLPRFSWEWASP
jgi:hypothetical protein